MNKQGRRTVELLGKLRETRALIEERGPQGEDGDITGLLESYSGYIDQGEAYQRHWEDIVHSGGNLPPSQALAFKREWLDWGKTCMQLNAIMNLPPEQLRQILLASQEE
jgi:hypothetical protein